MEQMYDAMKKKERDNALEAAKKTAVSAGEWGSVYGALEPLLYGQRSIPRILGLGLGSGLTAAALGGGSAYLGHKLMGEPDPGDPSASSTRGLVGGALGGGALGGAGGYLLGSGKLNRVLNHGSLKTVAKGLPLDNIITDRLKKQMLHPSHGGGLKTALALGLAGAAYGGFKGFESGGEQDQLRNLAEEDPHAA